MEYTANNGQITLTVKSRGAEIKSLIDNETGKEYIWQADPEHWGSSSPILFPVVGGLVNQAFIHEGKSYPSKRHGFAREKEFTLIRQENSSLWFRLTDSEETMELYPFHFVLEIGYELCAKSVKVQWRVTNTDKKEMYFSIGGHPAFVCPFEDGGQERAGYIGFEEKDRILSTPVTKTGFIGIEPKVYALEHGLLKVEEGLFDDDALVIDNRQVQSVVLYDTNRKPYVTVRFDAPLFGVWSMPESDARFICIEPWYGLGDREDFRGELKERIYSNTLQPDQCFDKYYTIELQ